MLVGSEQDESALGVRKEWFKQVLQSALLTTTLDAYSDFGAVGASALEMTAAVHDVPLTEDNVMSGVRLSRAYSPACSSETGAASSSCPRSRR